MTWPEVVTVGLTFPKVELGQSYGAPALKVKKKLLVRWREEIDSIVLATPFDRREELIAEDPDTYYLTDHYLNYEYVLARLPRLTPELLKDLLGAAYRQIVKP